MTRKEDLTCADVEHATQSDENFWSDVRLRSAEPLEMPGHAPQAPPAEATPPPTEERADPDRPPGDSCGYFASWRDGRGFRGSACAIHSRIVFTAAHCVFDAASGEARSDLAFLPRYWGNVNPWTYRIRRVWYFASYPRNRKYETDFVMCVTDQDMSSRISHLDSNPGFSFSAGRPIAMYGYPSGKGTVMHRDNGFYLYLEGPNMACTSALAALPDRGVSGASGGPWLDRENRVIGINVASDHQRSVTSPRIFHDGAFQEMYGLAVNSIDRTPSRAS